MLTFLRGKNSRGRIPQAGGDHGPPSRKRRLRVGPCPDPRNASPISRGGNARSDRRDPRREPGIAVRRIGGPSPADPLPRADRLRKRAVRHHRRDQLHLGEDGSPAPARLRGRDRRHAGGGVTAVGSHKEDDRESFPRIDHRRDPERVSLPSPRGEDVEKGGEGGIRLGADGAGAGKGRGGTLGTERGDGGGGSGPHGARTRRCPVLPGESGPIPRPERRGGDGVRQRTVRAPVPGDGKNRCGNRMFYRKCRYAHPRSTLGDGEEVDPLTVLTFSTSFVDCLWNPLWKFLFARVGKAPSSDCIFIGQPGFAFADPKRRESPSATPPRRAGLRSWLAVR